MLVRGAEMWIKKMAMKSLRLTNTETEVADFLLKVHSDGKTCVQIGNEEFVVSVEAHKLTDQGRNFLTRGAGHDDAGSEK